MRLNLHLRGIDLIDVEFHAGSRGLYLDVNVFQPRNDSPPPKPAAQRADMSGTSSGSYERGPLPVLGDDMPAVVHRFGFGPPEERPAP